LGNDTTQRTQLTDFCPRQLVADLLRETGEMDFSIIMPSASSSDVVATVNLVVKLVNPTFFLGYQVVPRPTPQAPILLTARWILSRGRAQ